MIVLNFISIPEFDDSLEFEIVGSKSFDRTATPGESRDWRLRRMDRSQ